MNKIAYELNFTHSEYEKEFDRFVEKKKYKKLPATIAKVLDDFEKGILDGKIIKHSDEPPYDVHKLRLPHADNKAGKSDGYRLIYLARHDEHTIAFLYIYYKKEQETIADEHVKTLVDGYFLHTLQPTDVD